jgi:hypothetical protein
METQQSQRVGEVGVPYVRSVLCGTANKCFVLFCFFRNLNLNLFDFNTCDFQLVTLCLLFIVKHAHCKRHHFIGLVRNASDLFPLLHFQFPRGN